MHVLITGGSSGIGKALALRLSKPGNKILLTGRSEDRLKQAIKKVEALGAEGYYTVGDVGKTNDVKEICKEARSKMGAIDLLVLNAGTGAFKQVEDMSDEDFDSQFNTNVRGVWLFIREILPSMKQNDKGQIIVTSSNLGFAVSARASIYAATKHAVQAMVGSIRRELQGTQVKIATINPGSVDTPWFSNYDSDKANPRRLNVEEVVDAFILVINQGKRSNIDHILLQPTNN